MNVPASQSVDPIVSIKRLILFAGPPCSGKSTVIKKVLLGNLPSLAESLQLGEPSSWKYIQAAKVHELSGSRMDRVILHYDILRQWRLKLDNPSYEDDKPLGLLDAAEETTFVTLWTTPALLSRRLKLRETRCFIKTLLSLDFDGTRESIRNCQVNKLYVNPPKLFLHYDKWFSFCGSFDAKENWIMDTTKNIPELIPASKWLVRDSEIHRV